MAESMLPAYKSIRDLHQALYVKSQKIKEEVVKTQDLTDVADTALLIRKSVELLDDSRKELNKLLIIMANATALAATAKGETELPRGKFAKAYFRMSFSASLPSHTKDPEKYKKVCEALNVPYNGMSRLHYPTIRDYITTLMEGGKQLPPVLESLKQTSEVKIVATATNDLDAATAKCTPLI